MISRGGHGVKCPSIKKMISTLDEMMSNTKSSVGLLWKKKLSSRQTEVMKREDV